MAKWFGKERNKFTVAGNHEYKEDRQYIFHTVVSGVSPFVGNFLLKLFYFTK